MSLGKTLPFGLRNVKLTPIASDGTLGTTVPLPVSRTFTFKDTMAFETLEGDDKQVASHGSNRGVDWELESGGCSFEAWLVMAGGSIAASGTTPTQKKVLSVHSSDDRPYFLVEGQAISDSGGDMHGVVYKCKAEGDLEGGFENGSFFLTKASGKGYGRDYGAADDLLYDFVQNETITSILGKTLVSIAITPLTKALGVGAIGKLVATGTYSDSSTADISSVVSWLTTDATKATVATGGFVTGVAAGTASISCKQDGITSTAPCVVTVS